MKRIAGKGKERVGRTASALIKVENVSDGD